MKGQTIDVSGGNTGAPSRATSVAAPRSASDGDRPLISFLTTAYRSERFVPAMVESVLSQTDQDWELVFVDNGMADTMAAAVEPYLDDPRIRFVRQPNAGYRGGVTAAAEHAAGTYFCVLDSDDRVSPDLVATVRAFLARHPDVDAVGCDAVQFDEDDQAMLSTSYLDSIGVTWKPHYESTPLTFADVVRGVVPYYSGAIRREAWSAVGGYAAADADVDESVVLWFNLVQRFDVRIVPDCLGWYRTRQDSLSHDAANIEAFERTLITTFERAASSSPDLMAAAQQKIAVLRFHQALRRARIALLTGDDGAARRYAREALQLQPGPRAAGVVASLSVSPSLLRWLHPRRRALTSWWRRHGLRRAGRAAARAAGGTRPATSRLG